MKSAGFLRMFLWMATAFFEVKSGAQVLNYSATPLATDNFLEANFRFVFPQTDGLPKTVLVFIPGTDGDGRGVVNDPTFLAMARACHAALIGCNYRAEGLPYENPMGGSGRALNEALSHFSDALHKPELAHLPLLLVGYSRGGIFTYNYVCTYPDRIGAFAALKAVSPQLAPKAESFTVPGLLVAGEDDDPVRIRNIAKAFSTATGHLSHWTFLFERGTGHELDHKSLQLVSDFFASVCGPSGAQNPILMNCETGNVESVASGTAETCWLPGETVAEEWKTLLEPLSLDELRSLPERPQLQKFISVNSLPDEFKCANGAQQAETLEVTSQTEGVSIDHIEVSGENFSVTSPQVGKPPISVQIRFSPQQSPWGRVRGEVEIGGLLNGKRLDPLDVPLTGEVSGPVAAIPSLIYLGVVSPDVTVEKQISLATSQPPVHVVKISASKGIIATFEGGDLSSPHLDVQYSTGSRIGQINGLIQLYFDSPEPGTLKIPVVGVVAK